MTRKLIWLLTCAFAIGLIAAGCGDDDDDGGDGGGEALTQEEFLAQGNEICAAGNAELEESEGPAGDDRASFETFVRDTLVPNIQGQIDDLRELDGPDEDEETLAGILDQAQTELDAIEADPTSVGDDSFADVQQQFTDLGLDECAAD